MHQLARLARGRHKVVPAPRDHGVFVQTQNAPADGVAVMMIVKQPAVEAGLADCLLNRIKVHTGHFTRAGSLRPANRRCIRAALCLGDR